MSFFSAIFGKFTGSGVPVRPTSDVVSRPDDQFVPTDFVANSDLAALDGAAPTLRRIVDCASPDFEALVALVLSNPQYRLQTQQRMPVRNDAVVLLEELPPGAHSNQKYVWGVWHCGTLVGCLEIIRGWPESQVLYIGFLLVSERLRHQGLASAALKMLAVRSRNWRGIRRWQLGVVETQVDAVAFWKHSGFVPTGPKVKLPQYRSPVLVMEKIIRR